MRNGLQWALAAALAVSSIQVFTESLVAGTLFWATAAIATPPIWNAIHSRTGFGYRKSAGWTLYIIGVIIWTQSPKFQARMKADRASREAAPKQEVVTKATEQTQSAAEKPAPASAEPPVSKPKLENAFADTGKQYAWIEIGKEAITAKLKDPESAQFRNVRFYSGGGVPVACGEVNAKNGFGGYNGYEHFIAAGPELAYLESEVSDGIGKVWNKLCVPAAGDEAHSD